MPDFFLHAALPVSDPFSEMEFIPDECYEDIDQEPPRVIVIDLNLDDDDVPF